MLERQQDLTNGHTDGGVRSQGTKSYTFNVFKRVQFRYRQYLMFDGYSRHLLFCISFTHTMKEIGMSGRNSQLLTSK